MRVNIDQLRQRSDPALESEVEDPVVTTELIAIFANGFRLRRLADKIKSSGTDLANEDPSESTSLKNKDVFAGFDDDLNDSAAVASSSRPAPKSAEDPTIVSTAPSALSSVVGAGAFVTGSLGLRTRNESESEEMGAEECLEDLIKQSLVLITSWKSDGKTKSCRLQSMAWDFCVRQAGQEKFLLSVADYFPNLILRRHFVPQVLQNHHR
ncbi:hypothetical protein SASPL_102935 [Salvia splendens]|uniref:Uncharacterized protein n=1 Tax=Salvia splendens TaxID=180675 RepID=A0A8X9ACL6_SALSN|nr:hypothetical protein SASPL_102935 [Salvia splendens]